MAHLARPFRTRLLLVVAIVAVVPLVFIGTWLTNTATRSAEDLLRARLRDTLRHAAAAATERWSHHRARLLDLAESAPTRRMLATGIAPVAAAAVSAVETPDGISGPVFVRDLKGREVWRSASAAASPHPMVPITVDVYESTFGPAVGSVAAMLRADTLIGDRTAAPGSIGAVVGLFDAGTRAPLVPFPIDLPESPARPFIWGGERWVAESRALVEPPVTLVAAAPLTPFEQPLREAARASLWVLGVVGLAGLGLAAFLTTRLAGSLERLAAAAEAVAAGDLDRRVDEDRRDEVGRVAKAFNRMTASLSSTLRALAEERALARVGEFAASLAHEIRNPLTAIRVDLQFAQESLPDGARGRRPLDRALADVDRLDRTVSGALLATRAARTDRAAIDVREPLGRAIEAARKTAARPMTIPMASPGEAALVPGDSGALEQLFLNLLLNACDAVRESGDIRVVIELEPSEVIVRVHDTGAGLTPEVARRAFDPLFTTRAGGTGLGLTIAGRLARAHDGSIALTGATGEGAIATVTLPRANQGPV